MIRQRGDPGWWAAKVRRVRSYLGARVLEADLALVAHVLSPAQLGLFRTMHPADQRHGLDVLAALRAEGATEPDLLVAGLLHDAGKGPTGLWPRVTHSLGQAYGPWIPRLARHIPGFADSLDRLADHPQASARLAAEAGCSQRTIDLIRWQDDPLDAELGRLLRLADEAS